MLSEDWVYLLRTYKKASCLMWASASLTYLWGDGRLSSSGPAQLPHTIAYTAERPCLNQDGKPGPILKMVLWPQCTHHGILASLLLHMNTNTCTRTCTCMRAPIPCLEDSCNWHIHFIYEELKYREVNLWKITQSIQRKTAVLTVLWSTHSNTSSNFKNSCTHSFTPSF